MFDELKYLVEKDKMAKRRLEEAISQKRSAEASLSRKQSEAKELLGIREPKRYPEIEYYVDMKRRTQRCDNWFALVMAGVVTFFMGSFIIALAHRNGGGASVIRDASGHYQYVEYKMGDRVRIVSDGKTIYGQVAAKRCGSVIPNTDGYGYGPPNKRQPACVYSIAREGWVRGDGTAHREPIGEMLENITAEKLRRF